MSFAAWWTLIVPTSFVVYLWIKDLKDITSTTGTLLGDVFAASVVTSILAIIANYFGMWLYLLACDHSRRGDKILWAILFFFTGPIATVPTFFFVYEKQFKASVQGVIKLAESG